MDDLYRAPIASVGEKGKWQTLIAVQVCCDTLLRKDCCSPA
ncbi:atpase aaa [Qipengyuania citrea LAMA 915]|uniref:Atpase aaa n=1 Tax=Qipengyuania citrea LAMA 915 TaxID=1306953 RepID=A0A0L1KFE1_9SPHN|nr:atpase aaa [Qipengyuania citrea LAMA 915]